MLQWHHPFLLTKSERLSREFAKEKTLPGSAEYFIDGFQGSRYWISGLVVHRD
jgi:hypothetical protein